MKLSIIIPVYNVEKYISRCLDSVYNQNISEDLFELVVVNDGTPDNSMEIVQQYASAHSNIRIINQYNGGVSKARNTGIDSSYGEYITFLDSDDELKEGGLESFMNQCDDSEIFVFNSCFGNREVYSYEWRGILAANTEYSGIELFSKYHFFRGSVCGAIYKKSFLYKHSIKFPLNVPNGEDTIFFLHCQSKASSIKFFDADFYIINEVMGSASRSKYTIEKAEKAKNGLAYIDNLISENNENQYIYQYLKYQIISNYVNVLVKSGFSASTMYLQPSINTFLPIKLEGITFKRNKIRLLNSSPLLFFALSKLKRVFK